MCSDDKKPLCVITDVVSLKQEYEAEELVITENRLEDFSIKREVPVENSIENSTQVTVKENAPKRRKPNNNNCEPDITKEHLNHTSNHRRFPECAKAIEGGEKHPLDKSELTCKLCKYDAANESALFKHVVISHFAIKLHITCKYCIEHHKNFNSYNSLFLHYEKVHNSYPDLKHHRFLCVSCNIVFPDTNISKHIENHLNLYGTLKTTKASIRIFTDNCARLALRKADCQINAVLNRIPKNELRCYVCKDHFFKEALKYYKDGYNRWCHLKCCSLEKNEPEIFPIDELKHELERLNAYFNTNDKTLLNGITRQAALMAEISAIKKQKVQHLEYFTKIKQFILNAKSKKINNCLSQMLCEQIERCITAGILYIESE